MVSYDVVRWRHLHTAGKEQQEKRVQRKEDEHCEKQNQQKRIIEHGLVVFYRGTKLQQTGKVNERLTGLRRKKTKRN